MRLRFWHRFFKMGLTQSFTSSFLFNYWFSVMVWVILKVSFEVIAITFQEGDPKYPNYSYVPKPPICHLLIFVGPPTSPPPPKKKVASLNFSRAPKSAFFFVQRPLRPLIHCPTMIRPRKWWGSAYLKEESASEISEPWNSHTIHGTSIFPSFFCFFF